MRARNFIGDADKIGNDYSDALWSREIVVEFGIDWNNSLTFTIFEIKLPDRKLSITPDQELYISDKVTFKINTEIKEKYKNFKLFVKFPGEKFPGERLEIQTENQKALNKIFFMNLRVEQMYEKNTLVFELECEGKYSIHGEKKIFRKEITILPPGDMFIFTKII
jgi:hypothetical protein